MQSPIQQRVHDELIAAGVTKHGLHKDEAKHLPNIINEDEHIMAAVNGRTDLGSVMLVATDKRVLYIDSKPFYNTVDELTYDVVSGVMHHSQGLYAQVVLHTRVGEYNLRFVNLKQARRFVSYLESKRLTVLNPQKVADGGQAAVIDTPSMKKFVLNKATRLFLQTHSLGVLSTADRTGEVYGAVVYYVVDADDNIYILTKSDTQKARNVTAHHQAALTIYDEFELKTLQIRGLANHESSQEVKDRVTKLVTAPKQFGNRVAKPPVIKLNAGMFVAIKLIITDASLFEYGE